MHILSIKEYREFVIQLIIIMPVIKPVIDLKIIIFTQLLNKTKNTKLKNSMLIKVSISFNVSDRFGNSAHDFIKFYR